MKPVQAILSLIAVLCLSGCSLVQKSSPTALPQKPQFKSFVIAQNRGQAETEGFIVVKHLFSNSGSPVKGIKISVKGKAISSKIVAGPVNAELVNGSLLGLIPNTKRIEFQPCGKDTFESTIEDFEFDKKTAELQFFLPATRPGKGEVTVSVASLDAKPTVTQQKLAIYVSGMSPEEKEQEEERELAAAKSRNKKYENEGKALLLLGVAARGKVPKDHDKNVAKVLGVAARGAKTVRAVSRLRTLVK